MTTVLDLQALQAAAGIAIPLADGVRVRSGSVTSEAVQGFSDVRAVELVVRVPALRGHPAPSVVVTVQQSTNGSDWTTGHAFTFTATGEGSFTLDAPDDYLRVVCAPSVGLREAVVSVVASIVTVDAPGGGGGGGSQPVAFKGPYTFAFNSANLDTPRTLFTVAPNDLVVFVPRYITPFDDGEGGINDAQLYLMVGDTALKPVSANRLQIEADITPALHNGGDAYVQAADNTQIPFFPLGSYGSTMVASVINSADVTAWVADGNGDPIAPTPTEGHIDLFFLVYTASL